MEGHTEGYVPVYTSQAASFVQTRLLAVLPPPHPTADGRAARADGRATQGPLPGPGPGPGPGPDGQGPAVVDQTQPAAFH